MPSIKHAKQLPPLEVYRRDQPKVWDYQYQENAVDNGRPLLKVPVNLGHGIPWRDRDGKPWESRLRPYSFTAEGKRIVHLKESTWVGSIGAMHYYARLNANGPCYLDLSEPDQGHYCTGGYGPEFNETEPWRAGLDIQVRRRLTKVEKNMNDEPLGKIGEWVYQFEDPADAHAAAIVTFLKFFGPGWVLIGYPKSEFSPEYARELPDEVVLAET